MREIIPITSIQEKILLIRGEKVILDRDLAQLYGVETRVLNQAVRRNIDRFPEDFMFKLTRDEIMRISQFVISSSNPVSKTLKFSKSVMVFTEHGVAMLSSVLNNPVAVQVNIQIMRTFAKIRGIMSQHKCRCLTENKRSPCGKPDTHILLRYRGQPVDKRHSKIIKTPILTFK